MEKIARRSPAGSFTSDDDLYAYPKRDSVADYAYGRAGGSPYRSPVRSTIRNRKEEIGLRPTADPVYGNENDIRMRNRYGSQYEDINGRGALERYADDDRADEGSHSAAPRRYIDGRTGGGYMEDAVRSRGRRYIEEEDPSYYHPNEVYDKPPYSHFPADYRNSEVDQAALLRQYAELQEKMHRMGISDQPSRRGQATAYPQGYDRADDLYAEDHYHRESGHSRAPYSSVREMEYVNSYDRRPPATVRNKNPHYDDDDDDPSVIQMPRRSNYQPDYHQQQPVDDHVRRRFVASNQDPDDESTPSEDRHHPNCVCSHCHASNVQTYDRPKAMPGDFGHRRSPNVQTESTSIGPDRRYNPQFVNPSSSARSSSAVMSDDIGTSQAPPRRAMVTNEKRLCRPIAGGAPFVVCFHCFQLLKLPKKVKAIKQSRMKCGSCFNILVYDLENKKPHVSVPSLSKPSSSAVENIISNKALLDDFVQKKTLGTSIAKTSSSETIISDKTGYTYRSTDSEPSMPLEDQRISFIEADKKQGILSPHSSHASKEECEDSDSISEKSLGNAPSSGVGFSPHGSLPPAHMDYYDVLAEAKRAMEAKDREGTDADGEGSMPLNSAQSRTQPTEIDINTDEMPNTDRSQGSTGTPSTKERRRKKEAGWFLPGLMGKDSKNSSVSSSMSTTAPRTDVFVNGQPILHRGVKRAEKLAGPISPGNYWYDSRAGFWGVVGGYCLGIIPPYIQDFGFPMQADCSGGNTSVYVNGRELHEIDLNVLASRGLPRTENHYYALDISGRVEIEDTGEYVADLKRLAPSVEKNRCGFGMKPPDTAVNR